MIESMLQTGRTPCKSPRIGRMRHIVEREPGVTLEALAQRLGVTPRMAREWAWVLDSFGVIERRQDRSTGQIHLRMVA